MGSQILTQEGPELRPLGTSAAFVLCLMLGLSIVALIFSFTWRLQFSCQNVLKAAWAERVRITGSFKHVPAFC